MNYVLECTFQIIVHQRSKIENLGTSKLCENTYQYASSCTRAGDFILVAMLARNVIRQWLVNCDVFGNLLVCGFQVIAMNYSENYSWIHYDTFMGDHCLFSSVFG